MKSCPKPELRAMRPLRAPSGDGAAACTDAPTKPLIDVASISFGLPDGVYYAGRQLTEWMSDAEHFELRDLATRTALIPAASEMLRVLRSRRAQQSIVVRWEIDAGAPAIPEVLRNHLSDGTGDDPPRAFTWGSAPADTHLILHAILSDVLRYGAYRSESSNDYRHAIEKIFPFGSEWVLPQRTVAQAIARKDLLDATRQASAVGLDAAIVLAEGVG
jgi:hypothetical protein